MRILLSTYGSRGDVEPVAALAVELQALGAEAVVSAPPDQDFIDLLARAGTPLAPAFAPVRQWLKEVMANRAAVDLPALAAKVAAAQYAAISAAAEGCDAIVAAGLFSSMMAARCVADERDLPYLHAAYCPVYLPSHHHAPHAYPGHPYPPEVTDRRALWDLNRDAMDAVFGGGFNALRGRLGLEAVTNVRDYVFTPHPWLASDPLLSPWAPWDLVEVVQTGTWTLADTRPLPDGLSAFLDAGAPPVYVGFGSMPMAPLNDTAAAAVHAARAYGRRVVLSQGWADLAAPDGGEDCFLVGDVNQQALFRRVFAVVHHGGAGTTAAAARAGAPQIVVPQIGDQPYWAGRVAELGIGVNLDGAPDAQAFAAALRQVTTAKVRKGAAEAAATMQTDGAASAAKMLLQNLAAGRA